MNVLLFGREKVGAKGARAATAFNAHVQNSAINGDRYPGADRWRCAHDQANLTPLEFPRCCSSSRINPRGSRAGSPNAWRAGLAMRKRPASRISANCGQLLSAEWDHECKASHAAMGQREKIQMTYAADLMRRLRGLAAAGVAAAAVTSVAPMSVAAGAGPFDGLAGGWTGAGMLTYASGTQERLSCRVQHVQSNPNNLQQALHCASDSYNFQINAQFNSANGRLSGSWSEKFLNVAGSVSGTVNNGRISGDLKGPTFVAQLSVVTKGTSQQVNIQAAIEHIRAVSVDMRKTN